MHYQRWWKHGDALYEAPTYDKCTINGCQNDSRSITSPYCEKHYYRIRRNGTTDTKIDMSQYERCLYCDALLPDGVNRYCSTTCEARQRRGTPLRRACKVCGTEFYPQHDKRCCSDECHAENDRAIHRKLHQKYYKTNPRYRALLRAGYHQRRLRINGALVDVVDNETVYERDGYICQLCGTTVDVQLKWPHPYSVSLDHIVPLSLGGSHSYDNVQCAHLRCNCQKGNRV